MNEQIEQKQKTVELPTMEQIQSERNRLKYRNRYKRTFRSTVAILIVVSAISILVATLWMPVLQIYGSSMTPTLVDGEIVFTVKTTSFKTGDIIAFYYNNKILVKRVIAESGEWVDIDEDGNVFIDGKEIEESYIEEKAYGDTNISLPYQVPDGKVFVLGDHRAISVDSRNTSIGCVSQEQIVGKVLFRVWPLNRIGLLE